MNYKNESKEVTDRYNTYWLIFSADEKRVMCRNLVFAHNVEMVPVLDAQVKLELNSKRDCELFLKATGLDIMDFVFKEEVVLY